jgi:putative nucleotidyltransferase with HDIG domain
MTTETLPDEQGCLELLNKYDTPEHIIQHSMKVWKVAGVLADGLMRNRHPLNMALLMASCLLHDIAKYPCIVEAKGWHDKVGEQMLQQEGLPTVGRIVVQHVIIRPADDGSVREEHVLNYSDKRVVHDQVVSLHERFEYLARTYGTSPRALEALEQMKEHAFGMEARIFALLDFGPEDVPDLVDRVERSQAL